MMGAEEREKAKKEPIPQEVKTSSTHLSIVATNEKEGSPDVETVHTSDLGEAAGHSPAEQNEEIEQSGALGDDAKPKNSNNGEEKDTEHFGSIPAERHEEEEEGELEIRSVHSASHSFLSFHTVQTVRTVATAEVHPSHHSTEGEKLTASQQEQKRGGGADDTNRSKKSDRGFFSCCCGGRDSEVAEKAQPAVAPSPPPNPEAEAMTRVSSPVEAPPEKAQRPIVHEEENHPAQEENQVPRPATVLSGEHPDKATEQGTEQGKEQGESSSHPNGRKSLVVDPSKEEERATHSSQADVPNSPSPRPPSSEHSLLLHSGALKTSDSAVLQNKEVHNGNAPHNTASPAVHTPTVAEDTGETEGKSNLLPPTSYGEEKQSSLYNDPDSPLLVQPLTAVTSNTEGGVVETRSTPRPANGDDDGALASVDYPPPNPPSDTPHLSTTTASKAHRGFFQRLFSCCGGGGNTVAEKGGQKEGVLSSPTRRSPTESANQLMDAKNTGLSDRSQNAENEVDPSHGDDGAQGDNLVRQATADANADPPTPSHRTDSSPNLDHGTRGFSKHGSEVPIRSEMENPPLIMASPAVPGEVTSGAAKEGEQQRETANDRARLDRPTTTTTSPTFHETGAMTLPSALPALTPHGSPVPEWLAQRREEERRLGGVRRDVDTRPHSSTVAVVGGGGRSDKAGAAADSTIPSSPRSPKPTDTHRGSSPVPHDPHSHNEAHPTSTLYSFTAFSPSSVAYPSVVGGGDAPLSYYGPRVPAPIPRPSPQDIVFQQEWPSASRHPAAPAAAGAGMDRDAATVATSHEVQEQRLTDLVAPTPKKPVELHEPTHRPPEELNVFPSLLEGVPDHSGPQDPPLASPPDLVVERSVTGVSIDPTPRSWSAGMEEGTPDDGASVLVARFPTQPQQLTHDVGAVNSAPAPATSAGVTIPLYQGEAAALSASTEVGWTNGTAVFSPRSNDPGQQPSRMVRPHSGGSRGGSSVCSGSMRPSQSATLLPAPSDPALRQDDPPSRSHQHLRDMNAVEAAIALQVNEMSSSEMGKPGAVCSIDPALDRASHGSREHRRSRNSFPHGQRSVPREQRDTDSSAKARNAVNRRAAASPPPPPIAIAEDSFRPHPTAYALPMDTPPRSASSLSAMIRENSYLSDRTPLTPRRVAALHLTSVLEDSREISHRVHQVPIEHQLHEWSQSRVEEEEEEEGEGGGGTEIVGPSGQDHLLVDDDGQRRENPHRDESSLLDNPFAHSSAPDSTTQEADLLHHQLPVAFSAVEEQPAVLVAAFREPFHHHHYHPGTSPAHIDHAYLSLPTGEPSDILPLPPALPVTRHYHQHHSNNNNNNTNQRLSSSSYPDNTGRRSPYAEQQTSTPQFSAAPFGVSAGDEAVGRATESVTYLYD